MHQISQKALRCLRWWVRLRAPF
uniref:Uncharacterized protein n=1 Tax=Anguilla anguilla TaxID=7936 RepID=A0A0E9P668_ANGAN